MSEGGRETIARIGNVRIVAGGGWWGGPGGLWAVRIAAVAVLLVWIAGVITVVWAVIGLVGAP